MKKTNIFLILGLFLVTIVFATPKKTATSDNGGSNIGKHYKDISDFSMQDFINMDLEILGFLPTIEKWKSVSENIQLIPIDALRYVDSLDVWDSKDTLYIKIYDENYAYQSKNTYKIVKKSQEPTRTLKVFNADIDFRMKNIISDARTFRRGDFTLNYVIKQNIDKTDKRILFDKKQLFSTEITREK